MSLSAWTYTIAFRIARAIVFPPPRSTTPVRSVRRAATRHQICACAFSPLSAPSTGPSTGTGALRQALRQDSGQACPYGAGRAAEEL